MRRPISCTSISRKAKDPELSRTPEQNEALAELLTLARARRAESDTQLSLGDEVMVCLRKAGVFRAMASREFGGDELPPSDFLRLVERISMADGSTGWIAVLLPRRLLSRRCRSQF